MSFLYSLEALAGSLPFGTLALYYYPLAGVRSFRLWEHPARPRHILTVVIRFEFYLGHYTFFGDFHCGVLDLNSGFTVEFCSLHHCISFDCDDFGLICSSIVTETMDETRVDTTDLEDGAEVSDFAELQAQYDHIISTTRALESPYALSDDSTHVGDLQSTTWMTPSSTTGSPLHLASLSPLTPTPDNSEPSRSPYPVGSLSTAVDGLGISMEPSDLMRSSLRDEILRELKQELFSELRSELLRSQQENVAFRKCIQELESGSVHSPGLTSLTASVSLIQPSLVSTGYPDSHSTARADQLDLLTQLGDLSATQLGFTTEEARWAVVKSNDNVLVTVDILFSCPPVPSARVRFESSHSDNSLYSPLM